MAYYCASLGDPEPSIFLVGQDAVGHYCVQENHGIIGGAFVNRAEAIRFAQDESKLIAGSVVLITPALIDLHLADIAAEPVRAAA